jgi:general secretion pathway protein A
VGLQCLRQKGTWTELAKLNRPAIVELQDQDNPLYFGAITGSSSTEVFLKIGARDLTVSTEDLVSRWSGSFVVLWQMPPKYTGSVKLGAQGPTVLWLRQQLARIYGTALVDNFNDYFDSDLTALVVSYQSSRGLSADGVVGPMTVLQINSETSDEIPRLST